MENSSDEAKRIPPGKNSVRVGLEDDTYKALRERSKQVGVPMTALVRHYILEGLERAKKE